ncbi:glycolate oxidase iron-sulfur subunit [Pseudomonas sp. WN033]|nr:glycolate oxidase iron-sulfur subunit [Pseudomonas sp. WN033]
MQTNLSPAARLNPRSDEAEKVLRSCVHCGFCNATCPTYQLTGDELDGPRGRIYLIKQLLEGEAVSASTQEHLDRCLSCRNCETTCPSGVEYHKLLDIGRAEAERQIPRPASQRLLRWSLKTIMPRPALFGTLLRTGQMLRPLLPGTLQNKVPASITAPGTRPPARHTRTVMLLEGCVQQSLSPNTNSATARVLDRLGISVTPCREAGCCGAVDYHLNEQEQGLERARRNIDAWMPVLEQGAEAIIQTASGCGAFIKEYGHLLRNDPAYADKARLVSERAMDLVELLGSEDLSQLKPTTSQRLAFHCPCTLQHAQKLGGTVESLLQNLGYQLTAVPDAHLCCGSAGTYSITQPQLSTQLRDNKLDALQSGNPDIIATANIGCQMHLESASRTPVKHWIELLDSSLQTQGATS